jgi:hypothetical protein
MARALSAKWHARRRRREELGELDGARRALEERVTRHDQAEADLARRLAEAAGLAETWLQSAGSAMEDAAAACTQILEILDAYRRLVAELASGELALELAAARAAEAEALAVRLDDQLTTSGTPDENLSTAVSEGWRAVKILARGLRQLRVSDERSPEVVVDPAEPVRLAG